MIGCCKVISMKPIMACALAYLFMEVSLNNLGQTYAMDKSAELVWDLMRSRILLAVNKAHDTFKHIRDNDVSIVFKPAVHRGVSVNKAFPIGQMTLVAFTTSINKVGSAKLPDDHVYMRDVHGPMHGLDQIDVCLTPMRQGPPDPAAAASTTTKPKAPIVVPYWFVRPTSEKDKANVEPGCTFENNISVPVYVNIKPLKKGQELLVYKLPVNKARSQP